MSLRCYLTLPRSLIINASYLADHEPREHQAQNLSFLPSFGCDTTHLARYSYCTRQYKPKLQAFSPARLAVSLDPTRIAKESLQMFVGFIIVNIVVTIIAHAAIDAGQCWSSTHNMLDDISFSFKHNIKLVLAMV